MWNVQTKTYLSLVIFCGPSQAHLDDYHPQYLEIGDLDLHIFDCHTYDTLSNHQDLRHNVKNKKFYGRHIEYGMVVFHKKVHHIHYSQNVHSISNNLLHYRAEPDPRKY